MAFDVTKLQWTREPAACTITPERIEIVTRPHTDLWQRTYYHFRNDNAPVLQMRTEEKFFSFVVKTEFTESHHRFDQCGVVLYLDSENWLKGSIEYENERFQHLGSVVTNHGYSDWATTEIPATVKSMWYRLSRRRMTSASNAPRTASPSIRCALRTFMRRPGKYVSASTPVAPRIPPSGRSSPTWS